MLKWSTINQALIGDIVKHLNKRVNPWQCPQLISQVSASEADEYELVVQGLCAFLLGICVLYNNEEVESHLKYVWLCDVEPTCLCPVPLVVINILNYCS